MDVWSLLYAFVGWTVGVLLYCLVVGASHLIKKT